MADSAVPITAGSGTNVDTRTQSGGDHRQVMVLGDAVDSNTASVFGAGFLRVMTEAHQVFYDPFDTAPDTTNLWTTSNAGGGTAPAVTTGTLAVGSGTTTAGYSKVTSIPTFKPTVPAWLGYSFAISMTDLAAPTAQTFRFWGAGTTPGSPTVAAPLTDAIGFELATDGKMYAVVYASGTRTVIQDLSAATGNSTQPTNTASHRYGVYYRTDRSYFFIDTLDNVVATTAFQSPNIQTLPVTLLAVAGTTPGSSGIISCTGLAVWDTAGNGTTVSDGTYPFRKAQVSTSGQVATSGGSLVGTSAAIAAAGTGTAGPLNVATAGNATFVVKNTIAASAWAGAPVIVFEQSDDNSSWSPLTVVRNDTGQAASTFLLGVNTASAELMFDAALEGVTYVRARVTTGPTTNGLTVVISAGGFLSTQGTTVATIPQDGAKTTGRVSSIGVTLAPHSTAANGQPFLTLINPSTTKVLRVVSIRVAMTITTTAAVQNVVIQRTTATSSGGTASAQAPVSTDSGDTVVATSNLYTAAPTANTTGLAVLGHKRVWVGLATATGLPYPAEWLFGAGKPSKAIVLRPGHQLGIAWGTAPASAIALDYELEWTEEPV